MTEPLTINIEGKNLASWIERLAKLAYDSPKVTVQAVAKDPAAAMHGAIVEMQEEIQSITSDILRVVKRNHDVYSWRDIVEDLRQSS